MPLPSSLADRVREARFWTDAYWITHAEWVGDEPAHGELGSVDFALGGHTLSLSLGDLYYLELSLDGSVIAYDDGAHWHPHLLRWEELDALCAAIEASDETLPHPGVPLLLLARFAPVVDEADAARATALIEAAADRLDVLTRAQRRAIFDHVDARSAAFSWTRDAAGRWMLAQPEDRRSSGRALYTLRSCTNDAFPFAALEDLLASARELAGPRETPDAAQVPAPLARLALDLGHEGGAPAEAPRLLATLLHRWLGSHGRGGASVVGNTTRAGGELVTTRVDARVRGDVGEALAALIGFAEDLGLAREAIRVVCPKGACPAPRRAGLSAQLANVEVKRWPGGARYDAPPLSEAQRRAVSEVLDAAGASAPDADGWREIPLRGARALRVTLVDGAAGAESGAVCVEASEADLEAAEHVHALARAARLYVLPPVMAPAEEMLRTLRSSESRAGGHAVTHPWPEQRAVGDARELLDVWSRRSRG